MASRIGDDELKLKQRARRRLIGAIALLVALVIVLPTVLDKQPKRSPNGIAVHIPAPQQVPAMPDPAPIALPPTVETKPAPAMAPPEPLEIKPEPAPVLAATPPLPKPKPTATGNFFVQVGVFSKAENAKSVQAKLAKNKLVAVADSIKTPGGTRTRVRIGPFANRGEADDILSQVKRAGEKNAAIVKVERSR